LASPPEKLELPAPAAWMLGSGFRAAMNLFNLNREGDWQN
jgi:hypothetical protein